MSVGVCVVDVPFNATNEPCAHVWSSKVYRRKQSTFPEHQGAL